MHPVPRVHINPARIFENILQNLYRPMVAKAGTEDIEGMDGDLRSLKNTATREYFIR